MMHEDIAKTCFFTGHRIIPAAHHDILCRDLARVCTALIERRGVRDFIAGGALGFDTLAALCVLWLRQKYPEIKLHLYIPCLDQSSRWRQADKTRWQEIAYAADEVRYITNSGYTPGCMQKRNRAMADDALYCAAYMTRQRGGTYQTVSYARELGRQIVLLPLRAQS